MDETITSAVPLGEGGGCMDEESGVVCLGSLLSHIAAKLVLYFFFPGLFFIMFSYFGSFMVVWGWVLISGFWGWGFHLMGFGACGVWPSGFFGLGLSI